MGGLINGWAYNQEFTVFQMQNADHLELLSFSSTFFITNKTRAMTFALKIRAKGFLGIIFFGSYK